MLWDMAWCGFYISASSSLRCAVQDISAGVWTRTKPSEPSAEAPWGDSSRLKTETCLLKGNTPVTENNFELSAFYVRKSKYCRLVLEASYAEPDRPDKNDHHQDAQWYSGNCVLCCKRLFFSATAAFPWQHSRFLQASDMSSLWTKHTSCSL